MIELPDKKKCFSLPEQVAQNLRNITFLAEQYKNIDALPAIWQVYKEEFDSEMETFEGWTTTFEGWDNTLSTYLANMSSAAVSALVGQDVKVKTIEQTNANYAVSFNLAPDGGASFTINNVYNRFEVINGILYFIMNIKVENNSGSTITVQKVAGTPVAVDPTIGAKLIDFSGNAVSDAPGSGAAITFEVTYAIKGIKGNATTASGASQVFVCLNHEIQNFVSVYVYCKDNISLADEEFACISARIPLTLI